MDVLKKLEKDHQISEDDHKRMDDRGAEGDRSGDPSTSITLLAAKEKEIMTV